MARTEEGTRTSEKAVWKLSDNSGRAAEDIVEVAEEIGAGLIVMGSRGNGRLTRALLGSASDAVVRHAHCPVTIVRE